MGSRAEDPQGERERMTTQLGDLLRLHRSVKDMGQREYARQIGISHATLCRIERGYMMDVATWLKVQAWLLESR